MSERPANRYIVTGTYRGYRLDRFIQAMIPKLSRARIQAAIRSRTAVSWHPRPRPSLTVAPGGEVAIFFPEIVEPEITACPRIVHEDESILVVDKPPGLLVHPTHSCLRNNLIHLMRAERPGIPHLALAHRLDRDTSGLILLSKTTAAARALATMFERREVEKSYLAIVHGRITRLAGTIDAPLGVSRGLQLIFRRSSDGAGAQPALTEFEVLDSDEEVSLVRLSPRTGRRHQLRAHLKGIGHPIVGDKLYGLSDHDYLRYLRGRLGEDARRRLLAPRHFLHAVRLRFAHPRTGVSVEFESPTPPDMIRFLEPRGLGLRERSGAAVPR